MDFNFNCNFYYIRYIITQYTVYHISYRIGIRITHYTDSHCTYTRHSRYSDYSSCLHLLELLGCRCEALRAVTSSRPFLANCSVSPCVVSFAEIESLREAVRVSDDKLRLIQLHSTSLSLTLTHLHSVSFNSDSFSFNCKIV